jgi:hypothetical protein
MHTKRSLWLQLQSERRMSDKWQAIAEQYHKDEGDLWRQIFNLETAIREALKTGSVEILESVELVSIEPGEENNEG